MQKKEESFHGEPLSSDDLTYVTKWLVRVGKKLEREGRHAVNTPKWEGAKLDKGLDAISFLFKSYRVSVCVCVLCPSTNEHLCA